MCVYIYVVELKTGPIFALVKVKNWSFFCFVFSSPCRKKRIFEKQAKKTHFLKTQAKKHNF